MVPNPVSIVWSAAIIGKYMRTNRGNKDPKAAKAVSRLSSQMMSTGLAYMLASAMEGDDNDEDKFFLMTGTRRRCGKGAWADLDAERREGMGPTKIRIGRGPNAVIFDYGRLDPASTVLATTIDWIRESKSYCPMVPSSSLLLPTIHSFPHLPSLLHPPSSLLPPTSSLLPPSSDGRRTEGGGRHGSREVGEIKKIKKSKKNQ